MTTNSFGLHGNFCFSAILAYQILKGLKLQQVFLNVSSQEVFILA